MPRAKTTIPVQPNSSMSSNNGASSTLKPKGVMPHQSNGTRSGMKPIRNLSRICQELQGLQRQRTVVIKSRIMQANRLQAVIAGTIGYSASMMETERRAKFQEATALIKAVMAGKQDHPFQSIIRSTMVGIDSFLEVQKGLEKQMLKAVRQLPVHGWVLQPEQRGFGEKSLGVVVGETGDLSNYANPAKVWRRMGCAPWEFDGETKMGGTWKRGKEGSLPAAEWMQYGYSPRRRSVAYVIGEGLIKLNYKAGDKPDDTEMGSASELEAVGGGEYPDGTDLESAGPYRLRYLLSKATFQANHPDYTPKRCHLHGMLLAVKLLLKNLWIEWHKAKRPL